MFKTNNFTKASFKLILLLNMLTLSACSKANENSLTSHICSEFNSSDCIKELNSYNFEKVILFKTKPMNKKETISCAADIIKTCSDFTTSRNDCMSAQHTELCDPDRKDCDSCNTFVETFAKITNGNQCIKDSRSYLTGCTLLSNYRATGSVGHLGGFASSIRNDLLSKLKFKAAKDFYKSDDFQNTLDGGEAFTHSIRKKRE